jgi:hypothetical protein
MRDTDWLDDAMYFEHVILVRADSTVDTDPRKTWSHTPYVPETHVYVTWRDSQVLQEHETEWTGCMHAAGWTPERGWSSQNRYRGPFMHASEFIGGGLERHILQTPGLWAAVVVECLREDPKPGDIQCRHCGTDIEEIAGNWEDPDGEWEDPASEGGPAGRRHCPESPDGLHKPQDDEDEDGEPAGWALLHMDLDEAITALEDEQAQALWVTSQLPEEHAGPTIAEWERSGHGKTLDQLRAMRTAAGLDKPAAR